MLDADDYAWECTAVPLAEVLDRLLAKLGIPVKRRPFVPLESRTEKRMRCQLETHCRRGDWSKQLRVETRFGTFWVDAIARMATGRTIGVECDGQDFHLDRLRDWCRDVLIVETGTLQVIYRVPGWIVAGDWHVILFCLRHMEPDLFDDRTREILDGIGKAQAGAFG